MATTNPYAQYQQNAILNARPEQLITALCNGAVKFIRQADQALENGDIQAAHHSIIRAQDIVTHLQANLNMDYEVSQRLDSLYGFLYGRLVQANVKKDRALLNEALGLMEEVRDTWAEAVKKALAGQ